MEQLRDLLIKNNFPSQIIEKEFEKFRKSKTLNVEKTINPETKIKYLSLPYVYDKSEIVARKIKNIVKEHFQNVHNM